jgi:hypothetical protein
MIYDTDDNRILSTYIPISSSETKSFTLTLTCTTGYFFRGEVVANLTVEAKHSGSGSWTNIETTPIALATWNGTNQDFNVRITSGAITTRDRRAFRLSVGR